MHMCVHIDCTPCTQWLHTNEYTLTKMINLLHQCSPAFYDFSPLDILIPKVSEVVVAHNYAVRRVRQSQVESGSRKIKH